MSTVEAFQRAARAATRRLVVMMPFIDQRGFEWIRGLFLQAPSAAEKVLVLRNIDQHAAELAVHHGEWLRQQEISVRGARLLSLASA